MIANINSREDGLVDSLMDGSGTDTTTSRAMDWNSSSISSTPTNFIETWGAYVVQMALPGIRPETVELKLVARRLFIEGKFGVPVIEGGNCVRKGIPSHDFHEEVDLPGAVNPDTAHAQYDRGILTIELPKVAHLRPSLIRVDMVA